MMTTETAMVGPLGECWVVYDSCWTVVHIFVNNSLLNQLSPGHLISQDRVLQVMQNATLVVHLLNEKYTENSFWKPYIGVVKSGLSLLVW